MPLTPRYPCTLLAQPELCSWVGQRVSCGARLIHARWLMSPFQAHILLQSCLLPPRS